MSTLTPAQLSGLRVALSSRLDVLRGEIHAAEQAARQPAAAVEPHDVADLKDRAGQDASTQLHDAETQRDIDEFAIVQAALARLDAGTYGACVDCGEAIALARLQAQPAAARCTACQAAAEARLARR
jgi:RNA polymerase-binding protein DksA